MSALLHAGGEGTTQAPSSDPFQRTEYVKAFDQRHIWKKHRRVLVAEGLEELLSRESTSVVMQYARGELEPKGCFSWLFGCCSPCKPSGYKPLPTSEPSREATESKSPSAAPTQDDIMALNAELVAHFIESKKSDAYRPIKDDAAATVTYGVVMTTLIGGASAIFPPSAISMGTGIGGFVIADQAAGAIYRSLKTLATIRNFKGGSDPLFEHELQYAISKRFIDPRLWPEIESSFLSARTNVYARDKQMAYIKTVLSVPRAKKNYLLTPPAEELKRLPGEKLETKTLQYNFNRLVRAVDEVFAEDYVDADDATIEIITSFWQHMLASADKPAFKRNLFVVGAPGHGKTRLAKLLTKKLDMHAIELDLSAVGTPADLLGTAESPGVLLAEIVKSEYTNPVVIADEASEVFNNPDFVASFKALLEPKLGHFLSPYLKTEVDITGFFWFTLGNFGFGDMPAAESGRDGKEEKKSSGKKGYSAEGRDETALASRFVVVPFPCMTKEKVRSMSTVLVTEMLKSQPFVTRQEDADSSDREHLTALAGKCCNVRELERALPAWCTRVNVKAARKHAAATHTSSS